VWIPQSLRNLGIVKGFLPFVYRSKAHGKPAALWPASLSSAVAALAGMPLLLPIIGVFKEEHSVPIPVSGKHDAVLNVSLEN
jgi:hypothetical protein